MLRGFTANSARAGSRYYTQASEELKQILSQKIPKLNADIAQIKKQIGDEVLAKSTVEKSYGGMRDLTAMVYEPSLLDANEGIRFRGLSIPECQEQLPKWKNGTQMAPEGMLWLLLTGDVPTQSQVESLAKELHHRATSNKSIVQETSKVISALPTDLHPMNQFSVAVLALGKDSEFARQYSKGIKKTDYWQPALEDSLNLIARITQPCAQIYRRTFKGKDDIAAQPDAGLDWTGNFMRMMGNDNKEFAELMRLYFAIHVDHEGGNVSAHTTVLVGSALSDPYLSFSAGLNGLAGPLHGLANQEVLAWLDKLRKMMADKGVTMKDTDEKIKKVITEITWETLNKKQVVPGYGHAVLRKTDPRYTCQREFAQKYLPKDDLFRLVSNVYEVMPKILLEHGKTKNPYPNVDAHSGCLLQYYGMKEQNFYTVLFGISRALGVLSAYTWDRATGKPIERPKSVDTPTLKKLLQSKAGAASKATA